ncbi:lytic transglycosylase domain-containing protein [Candidatus Kaiserbacteria bacterium]|nr:lytic transglycosylase domain-containing protein [Candidatus Kaiserbacteria bacterium]
MSEGEFKVIKETEYGPQLVRVGSAADPEAGREDLGVMTDESRRKFMFGVSALGGALALLSGRALLQGDDGSPSTQSSSGKIRGATQNAHEHQDETLESGVRSFEGELAGYRTWFGLKKNEVVFVDKNNVPVGRPVQLREVVAPKFHKDGRVAMREYKYSPGPLNEIGIPGEGISGEWLDLIRDGLAYNFPDRQAVRPLHAVIDFNKALHEDDEPGLVDALKAGQITDYKGLVEYFADKPVVGAEHLSRVEYVEQMIQFEDSVPAIVQAELRRILPGLCAQESKFNNGLTSVAGARGIFQFMPDTWAHYGGTPEEVHSLRRQVEIAGHFFSDLYREVLVNVGTEAIRFLEMKFGSRELLERQLIVPLMVNSYNAGSSRVADAVKEYIRSTEVEDMPDGQDLFLAIADFAVASKRGRLGGYGKHAREYVPRIYAQAEVLRGEQ